MEPSGSTVSAHMAPASAAGTVLVLIDPPGTEHHRARRYAIHLQPTLFGGIDVVREWGRVDAVHRPRRLVTHHDDEADAETAAATVIARRLRRGYLPAR